MPFMSLVRVFNGKQRATTALSRLRGKKHALTNRARLPYLEKLEDRTLLAVIPPPLVTGVDTLTEASSDNQSNAVAVVSPRDPKAVVSFWLDHLDDDNVGPTTQDTFIRGSSSVDGGATWNTVLTAPGNFPNPTLPPPTIIALPHVSKPSIAIDRGTPTLQHVYVVYAQYSDDFSLGLLVMQRYDFNPISGTLSLPTPPSPFVNKVLARWYNQGTGGEGDLGFEAVYNPVVVVDSSVASYNDPQGPTQTNPNVNPTTGIGVVYVTWNTNYAPFDGAGGQYQGNTVKIIASADGGANFTAERFMHDTTFTGNRMSSPQLAISQGKMFPGSKDVVAGQLTAVWDNFHQVGVPSNVPDEIMVNKITNGGNGVVGTGSLNGTCSLGGTTTMGDICDAVDPGDGGPHMENITSFTTNVSFDAAQLFFPAFGTQVTGLSVTLNIDSEELNALEVVLVPPTGSGIAETTLFRNRTNTAGEDDDDVGLVNGQELGVIQPDEDLPGIPWDTVFDFGVPRRITDPTAVAPWTAHFLPELGNLPQSFTVGSATGLWTLRITKTRASADEDAVNRVINWSLNFTGRLTPGTAASITDVARKGGILAGNYLSSAPNVPLINPVGGIGPNPVIVSDNTLGAFSPFQGRLYLAFTANDPANSTSATPNTNVILLASDNGGGAWFSLGQINDDSAADGFSTGSRAQFQPQLAVDQHTGTLVATFLDVRYDPSLVRYVNTVTASIDGGASFNKQVWMNPDIRATDAITGEEVVIQPIPGNQSASNARADDVYGLGDQHALAVGAGKIYGIWANNHNGGRFPGDVNNPDDILRQQVWYATALIAAGPRVIDSTMGPAQGVNVAGFEFNNTFNPQGLPLVDGFVVIFDRPVDPGSIGPAQVQTKYLSTVPQTSFVDIAVDQVIPLNNNPSTGATAFFIHFTTPQISTGTYSYVILPVVRDRIRKPAGTLGTPGCPDATYVLGNCMDQNANAIVGELPTPTSGNDSYGAPTPLDFGPNFQAPFSRDTLPIIIPGPYVAKTNVVGNPITLDNLAMNQTVSSIDVTFDRDMQPGSITPASILRMMGPAGVINGPFTITPNPLGNDSDPAFPRTYRIGFPAQVLSGTYTISFAPTALAKGGKLLDTEKDAGVDLLFQTPSAGTEPKLFANGADFFIAPNSTIISTITVNEAFVIQGVTIGNTGSPGMDINFPDTRFLSAKLIAPDGTEVLLFTKPGTTQSHTDVKGTILDDEAKTPQGGTNPIQSAPAPFDGRFNPQKPLFPLKGKLSTGQYQLVITNSSPSLSGILNAWSLVLQKAISQTGLGEPVADQASISFRIFSVDKKLPIASQTWTAVGGASNNNNSNSSRIGGIAVDPSDPSGNTVFVAGASGGVWKTTNFMTQNPLGPTWIPLTDFGATFNINIGGIGVFPRNNDPKQTMVFVATGEGDTFPDGLPNGTGIGRGIIRSMDGGATWTLLDSTDNTLPYAQRDHRFFGTSAFKIVVDPKASPIGPNEAVVYAVLTGTDSNSELTVKGGIWKSVDSGRHWFRLTPAPNTVGFADPTDLVFAPSTGDANTGNLRLAYAAWRGKGVYLSGNSGSGWQFLPGLVGNPLLRDPPPGDTPIPVTPPTDDPNGANGRIVLATPALSGSRAHDLSYQGWVYAWVSTPGGTVDGFYVSKDFGQNWTKVKIGAAPCDPNPPCIPTNDDTRPDVELFDGQGEYDIAITVDPTNPNIVYLGGDAGPKPVTYPVIRLDITGLHDPHAVVAFNNFRNDGGKLYFQTKGPIALKTTKENVAYGFIEDFPTHSPDNPYLNLFRDPNSPFANGSTLYAGGGEPALIATFTNDGLRAASAGWVPFSVGGVDMHEFVAMLDPLTGHARIIYGNDQGLFTAVDQGDGTFSAGVGTKLTPFGPVNGNLQINQFYAGATQPSLGAADKGGGMFYGAAQDNGTPQSDKDVLENGNIQWTGPGGDASWVETDQTGSGKVFHYKWPCCGGNTTDFFQVDNVGHTVGLLQEPVDPQWPETGGARFAVNPINPDQVVIASLHGRVFRTGGLPGGYTWFVIGEPSTSGGPFDNTNSFPKALAFGAPDPSDPTQQTDNHIWIGNDAGNTFVTFDGGGHWIRFGTTEGLDGSPVQQIVTNPKRGSHEAYAVTLTGGVYWMADSAIPGATWVNVTGDVFTKTIAAFGDVSLTDRRLHYLTTIQADWRYAILDNPSQPNGLVHPILYVGGNGGVYRSLNKGQTWTVFPNVANDGAPVKGGYLPNAEVSRLELSLGNVNPETGIPDPATSEELLVAHTYGRGSFMIRLKAPAPIEEAFVRGLDQQIYAQRVDANGNPIGGYFLTAPGTFSSFVVGRQGDKLPQLFALGFDNQVYTQRFDNSGASTGPWSLTAPGQWKSVAVGNLPSGAPEVFTVGFDDRLYALKFDLDGNPIGGYFATQASLQVKQIFVGHDTILRPQVWAVGFDNQVYSQKFGMLGNSASQWFLTAPGAVKSVTVAHDQSGRPETFVIGTDNNVYYQKFDNNGFPIGGYSALAQKQVSKIIPAHDGTNKPEIFVLGFDQTVYGHRFGAAGTPIGSYFLAAPGQVKNLDVGFDLNNNPELFVIGLDDQVYFATFFASGLPATGYKLLTPGKVIGLKVTK